MASHTNRVTQMERENTYNKKRRTEIIKNSIANTEGASELVNKLSKAIKKYALTLYSYDSKNHRLQDLRTIKIDKFEYFHELALEVLTAVLPLEQYVPIQNPISLLEPLMPHKTKYERLRTASELVALTCFEDITTIQSAKSSSTGSLTIRCDYKLDDETKAELAKTMYMPPMVSRPDFITKNHHSGHLTFDESVILGKENHHCDPISLDIINILNQQVLSLDTRMLQYEERPNKELDTPEKLSNFELLRKTSVGVYNEILEQGNKFHNLHKFDKRGRVYSCGYHVHIQSTDYKKSLINLNTQEVITV